MYHLLIVACSTRPTRIGYPLTAWAAKRAELDGRFSVEIADLRELALPNFDEPHHPRSRRYEHEHTRQWSRIVERADAVVFVTPEYNHSFPGALKNALDFLHEEWKFKPAGFISYGGIAAGARAVQMLKPVLDCLRMIPVYEGVNIAYAQEILAGGRFAAKAIHEDAATQMLDTLFFWAARNSSLYIR
ncbi:NAD(P)H-dependent oxidoreductase [Rhizobium sp. ICMP 5592]|uniref:NADPH-dependent FMN reductase n=1 Tax=Rhizobium sp. ICMP 5592 TaxID=2292445 RepID=UPI0012980D14|nr:NAD(P)H-dependent oxidoreductase [Rhizobium sp. ICMP 5592]MQB45944.1 NADPH-dependent oxidoreductase [Rhizobium sp. ICMP 5592]